MLRYNDSMIAAASKFQALKQRPARGGLAGRERGEESEAERFARPERGRRRHAGGGDQDFDYNDDDGDDGDDDDWWGGGSRRRGSGARRRVAEYDSEGESESFVDSRLWQGATAEGWRVHKRGTRDDGHYVYVSPTGDRYKSRGSALLHAGGVVPARALHALAGEEAEGAAVEGAGSQAEAVSATVREPTGRRSRRVATKSSKGGAASQRNGGRRCEYKEDSGDSDPEILPQKREGSAAARSVRGARSAR